MLHEIDSPPLRKFRLNLRRGVFGHGNGETREDRLRLRRGAARVPDCGLFFCMSPSEHDGSTDPPLWTSGCIVPYGGAADDGTDTGTGFDGYVSLFCCG